MSGGNCPETPRQKMIGMMYLMLTAMLALNVSGDLLNAFTLVDKSIREQKSSTEEKLRGTYYNFEAKVSENKEKFGSKYESAMKVKAMSDSLVSYIQDIKQEMVWVADGRQSGATPDSFVNISNQDIAMQVMDISLPRGYETQAAKAGYPGLLAKIADYRESVIDFIRKDSVLSVDTAAMNSMISNIEHMLKTVDKKSAAADYKDQEARNWASQQFEHLPLAASFGLLSSIQGSARLVESDVVNAIYSSIEAASFKFTTLIPLIIPESQYVIQGGQYKADIMLAAYDDTMDPIVSVGGEKLKVEGGRGKYAVPASSVGMKNYTAKLEVPDPITGVLKPYTVQGEYEVGAPSLVVSATKMNAMYRGLANPIEVSVAGVSPSDLHVSASGGNLSRGGQGYVVSPGAAKEVVISVTASSNGRTQNFGSKSFRVFDVPDPTVSVTGVDKNGRMSKSFAAKGGLEVEAKLENFVFDVTFQVVGFTVSTIKNGFTVEEKATSNKLTKAQQTLVNGVPRNGKIYIEGVQAKGPDGRVRRLNGLSIQMQ